MVKRFACSLLWFLAVGWGFNYLSVITGSSPVIGMAIAAAVGAFVGVDPLRLFWPKRVAYPAIRTRDVVPVSAALQTQV
jgi:uncharacterized membrane protein YjjB (DUF3815 family)